MPRALLGGRGGASGEGCRPLTPTQIVVSESSPPELPDGRPSRPSLADFLLRPNVIAVSVLAVPARPATDQGTTHRILRLSRQRARGLMLGEFEEVHVGNCKPGLAATAGAYQTTRPGAARQFKPLAARRTSESLLSDVKKRSARCVAQFRSVGGCGCSQFGPGAISSSGRRQDVSSLDRPKQR